MFCPNTGTKFREPYHLNHVIPHLDATPLKKEVRISKSKRTNTHKVWIKLKQSSRYEGVFDDNKG